MTVQSSGGCFLGANITATPQFYEVDKQQQVASGRVYEVVMNTVQMAVLETAGKG